MSSHLLLLTSIMEQTLYSDIIFLLCKFIGGEKDVVKFLSCNKYLHGLKNKIKFLSTIPVRCVYNLWYYDSFTNLKLSDKIYTHADLKTTDNIFTGCITHLPRNIKKLIVTNYEGSLDFIENSGLVSLFFTDSCKITTPKFPNTLQYLSWNINQIPFYTENIPKNLKKMSISNYQNESLVLPSSISTLVINSNCSFDHIETQGLKKLIINSDTKIFFELPEKLDELRINRYYYKFTFSKLPESLKYLVIGKYKENLAFTHLNFAYPVRIKTLVINRITFISSRSFPNIEKIFIKKNLTNVSVVPNIMNLLALTYLDYINSLNLGAEIVVT